MVLGAQIAGFLFGMFMLYYSFLNYKKKEFSMKEFVLWILLWGIFIVVALFPSILDPLSKTLNFARTFDLLVIGGFIYLAFATFYNYSVIRKTQRQLETVVREISFKRSKK